MAELAPERAEQLVRELPAPARYGAGARLIDALARTGRPIEALQLGIGLIDEQRRREYSAQPLGDGGPASAREALVGQAWRGLVGAPADGSAGPREAYIACLLCAIGARRMGDSAGDGEALMDPGIPWSEPVSDE